jgi:hypothetical protein
VISERNQNPDLHRIRSQRVLRAMRDHQRRHKLVLRAMKTVLREADPVDAEIAAAFWLAARRERNSAA